MHEVVNVHRNLKTAEPTRTKTMVDWEAPPCITIPNGMMVRVSDKMNPSE